MKKILLITIIILVATSRFSFGQATTKNLPYQASLDKLNEYLEKFNINRFYDRFIGIVVKDGYLYSMYENELYEKASIGDIEDISINDDNNIIYLKCKNNSSCVYSAFEKRYFNAIDIDLGEGDFLQFDLEETNLEDTNSITVALELFREFLDKLKDYNSNNPDSRCFIS